MERQILLTGFAPFGGERVNPSWEVARLLDGREFGGATVAAMRLPVACRRASRIVAEAIEALRPAAVIGLGQAGGRPALAIEKVAINLADERAARENSAGVRARPVVAGAPDAYFARIPIDAIALALRRHGIPAEQSLSAGLYVCNTVMYTALHTLRRRPRVPSGFIHLPYTAAQAASHRAAASMTIELMAAGVETALGVIARKL